MKLSGIDIQKSSTYFIRSAASSKKQNNNNKNMELSFKNIIKYAGWKSEKTLARHIKTVMDIMC